MEKGYRKNKPLQKIVAARLKQIREERHLTQHEVDTVLGIGVGRIEMGLNNIGIVALSDLCCFYDISFSEFFRDIEPTTSDQALLDK